VLHALAIVLYPLLQPVKVGSPLPFFVTDQGGGGAPGMRIIRIQPVEDAGERSRPAQPAEVKPAEGPAIEPGVPDVSDPNRGGIVAPGPTAAERLRPHLVDPRIWAPLDEALNELTLKQRLELDLSGRVAEWQDSIQAALAQDRALTDWTKTDSKGRKWGVADGKLYLGDITIPFPLSFGLPVGRRDEFRRNAWVWDEIQRGAATGEMRDSWKERAKAIRERRDKERAAAKPDTSGVRR